MEIVRAALLDDCVCIVYYNYEIHLHTVSHKKAAHTATATYTHWSAKKRSRFDRGIYMLSREPETFTTVGNCI